MSVDTLWAMLGVEGGFHMVRSSKGIHWCGVASRRRFGRLVDTLGYDGDLTVTAVPRLELGDFRTIGGAGCLWVRCETPESVFRLRAFSPEPTLVVQEGASRRVALWALAQPLDSHWTERANKRIAHRLKAPKKHATPWFEFAVPGTVLRLGRKTAVAVSIESCSDRLYDARRVVGRLPDAPDPEAWREFAA